MMSENNSSSVPESAKSIDTDFLNEFYADLEKDGNASILKQLVDRFVQNVPEKIKLIQSAVEDEDSSMLQFEVHALLGRAANLGAKAMTEVCSELDVVAKKKSFQEAKALVVKLAVEYDRTCRALRGEFEK